MVKNPLPSQQSFSILLRSLLDEKKSASFATSSKQGEVPLDFKRNLFGSMISFLRMLGIVGTQLNGYSEYGLPFIPILETGQSNAP